MTVDVEVIADVDGLERLRRPWNELLDRVANSNPYQAPAYVVTWFRHYSAGRPVHVVTFRSDGELVGVAPFDLSRIGVGSFAVTRLKSAASGRVDYGDPLLADWMPELPDLLLDHLHGALGRPGSAAYLRGLRSDGPLRPALIGRTDLRAVPLADPLPAAVVRFDLMDDPVAGVRKIAQKRDVPRSMRRLSEQFEVTEMLDLGIDEGLDALEELIAKRWTGGDGPKAFATDGDAAFTRAVVRAMAFDGRAGIRAIRADGRPVWVALLLHVDGRVIGDTLAIDDDFRKYGPGNIGIFQTLERFAEQGDLEKDMLSGDFAYKHRWSNAERDSQSFLVVRDDALGRAQLDLRDRARRLRQRS
ncbi:MAG: GNAT family N-acetyltransferase [Acidimicrobiia bacterium]|nr:GNAT family N-acetyltransferase [Acidimicrobiia bacterium]